MYKSGYVAIVGSPNAGKSTLINAILDSKLAITSDKVNTTRNMIRGIYTDDEKQIIFIDTPGINVPQNKLQVYMKNQISEALASVDIILYILDAEVGIKGREETIIERISKYNKNAVIACVNKIDLIDQSRAVELIDDLQSRDIFDDIVAISLKEHFNPQGLLDIIAQYLPEGEQIYSEDEVTDMTTQFYISEIIREKVLRNTYQEIPHGVYVKVDEIEHEDDRVYIHGVIYVERESQKRIIIGSKGSMIRDIGKNARYDIERYYGQKVYLDLVVRLDKNWTNKGLEFFEQN